MQGDSTLNRDKNLLAGKKILIVDDEVDILETLEELLEGHDITTASNFKQAKERLETEYFDIAVLDIMGVNGYELLELANTKKVIAVMLTAHALSIEDTVKSKNLGASYYIPKEKMSEIATYLNDVLEARDKGRTPWSRWLHRFGSYYRKMFRSEWVDYEEFWKETLKDKDL